MPKNRIIWWIVAVIVVAGLVYFVALRPKPEKPNPNTLKPIPPSPTLQGEVTVGAILPLTGDSAAEGLALQKAMQLAVEEINAANGVGGKRLVLATEDGKCDRQEGAVAGQKLINVSQVKIILGGVCPQETLGFSPTANESKVVVISPAATSPDITAKGGDFVFSLAPSDATAGEAAAKYARGELLAKRAAVVSEKTDAEQVLRSSFRDAFKKEGGAIAYDETFEAGVTDFLTQAAKIRNANVDVVYLLPQTSTQGLAFLQTLKDQGVTAKILSNSTLVNLDLAKADKDTLEGMVGFIPFFDETTERVSRFKKQYQDRFGDALSFPLLQANAYSEVYLTRDLMDYAGDDTVKMQKALGTLAGWSGGALGSVTLDTYGDVRWKAYSVQQITDGGINNLKTIDI